ncbi:hypothetical protein GCM10010358_13130 [Streptomyces minutiscleroticus]|uniref:Uncharacterized protein n=1 Tax=Streptomyces minutiscleroticus TaxID=68238 RepID=A0A918KGJ1_9ACTN|nr:hypothetical protein GCM10010358_13130 [Streptomyces minutiscleroticus]
MRSAWQDLLSRGDRNKGKPSYNTPYDPQVSAGRTPGPGYGTACRPIGGPECGRGVGSDITLLVGDGMSRGTVFPPATATASWRAGSPRTSSTTSPAALFTPPPGDGAVCQRHDAVSGRRVRSRFRSYAMTALTRITARPRRQDMGAATTRVKQQTPLIRTIPTPGHPPTVVRPPSHNRWHSGHCLLRRRRPNAVPSTADSHRKMNTPCL